MGLKKSEEPWFVERENKMKLTKDQILLLNNLNDSHERGSASLSCNQRLAVADELVKLKLAERYPGYGYRITDLGKKKVVG